MVKPLVIASLLLAASGCAVQPIPGGLGAIPVPPVAPGVVAIAPARPAPVYAEAPSYAATPYYYGGIAPSYYDGGVPYWGGYRYWHNGAWAWRGGYGRRYWYRPGFGYGYW